MAHTMRIKCVVQGYHTFKNEWKREIGSTFQTMVEEANEYDRYAVAVHVESRTVFVPRFIVPVIVID